MNTPRARPLCRQAIITGHLEPYIEPDGRWRGRAWTPAWEVAHLSKGMRAEMRRMLREQFWLKTEKETQHVTARA
jgi:hypothetical protein